MAASLVPSLSKTGNLEWKIRVEQGVTGAGLSPVCRVVPDAWSAEVGPRTLCDSSGILVSTWFNLARK